MNFAHIIKGLLRPENPDARNALAFGYRCLFCKDKKYIAVLREWMERGSIPVNAPLITWLTEEVVMLRCDCHPEAVQNRSFGMAFKQPVASHPYGDKIKAKYRNPGRYWTFNEIMSESGFELNEMIELLVAGQIDQAIQSAQANRDVGMGDQWDFLASGLPV